jgi:hypothetical protein
MATGAPVLQTSQALHNTACMLPTTQGTYIYGQELHEQVVAR